MLASPSGAAAAVVVINRSSSSNNNNNNNNNESWGVGGVERAGRRSAATKESFPSQTRVKCEWERKKCQQKPLACELCVSLQGRAGSTWKEREAKKKKIPNHCCWGGEGGGEGEKGGEEARTRQVEKFEHFPLLFYFSAVVTGSSPAAAAGARGRSAATPHHFLGLRWAPFPSFAPFCFEEKEEKGKEEIQAPKTASIVSVCRCEQEEKGEKCEDERRWNNEFIAECHPAMAISTIRHCRLPLKGRASKPPLPHFLLI
ncbi:uncharacterized protein LOC122152919 [Tyto alba]|uniref:uncharacterized protein LOC122152919 n=1 Tax=Tyto alba TaxID=56313 RepID=UPI001C67B647|nr:uncharacterized protein LOC122152919 [Tyto alba]